MSGPSYHTFLSHNSADKPAVEALAHRLRREGLEPWLDKWNLIPGEAWQPAIAQALDRCQTCAVFIGPAGIGPWQNEEMLAAIDRRVSDTRGGFRVIPVLLPGGTREERSRLPHFLVAATWVEFRDSLEDGDAFHRLVCGIRGVPPGPGPGAPAVAGECPYRGLQAFDVGHAPFFFGREALTDWLLNELRPPPNGRPANRFLAVVGASGSGKSSLARAGLLARLARDGLPSSSAWPRVACRPGADPLESLAVALAAHPSLRPAVLPLSGLIRELQGDGKSLHRAVRVALHDAPASARVVVLVDQFEELFTQCRDEPARRRTVENLLHAATAPEGRTVVVLTMRADCYGRCAVYPELAAALTDHQVLVGPLGAAEMRAAIEEPARLAGCEPEPGLADVLLQDVRDQPGALPLLQHALTELWERRSGRRLTFAAYEAIGRVHGALERRANETFESFDEGRREACRRVFLRLTQPGEGTEDSKRRASVEELLPAGGSAEDVRAVLQALADARLVTVEGDPARPAGALVEVAHEALIRSWSRLRGWIEADREALRTHRKLSADAREWDARGRPGGTDGYLYSGVRLAVAEEWLAANPGAVNPLEGDFLQASRAWEQELIRWRQDRAVLDLRATPEMLLARQVQQSLLPTAAPSLPGLDLAGACVPVAAVGGDLFDFIPLPDGRLIVLISDAAGHGFAPALMVTHLRAALRTAAALREGVGEIVGLANRVVCEGSAGDTFLTLFLAELDPAGRSFTYVGAGEGALLLDAGGRVKQRLLATGMPLGIDPGARYEAAAPVALDAGDILLLVTDGVPEARNSAGEVFGRQRLLDLVRDARRLPAGDIARALCAAARAFSGGEQVDDMTAVVVKAAEA